MVRVDHREKLELGDTPMGALGLVGCSKSYKEVVDKLDELRPPMQKSFSSARVA